MIVFRARFIAVVVCCVYAASCADLPRHTSRIQLEQNAAETVTTSSIAHVNINTATAAELERLPGIGAGFAARIVEHRSRYGAFRRKEHLLIVRGMGERRYEAIESLIVVEERE